MMEKIEIKHDDLIMAGFVFDEKDPLYPYALSLMDDDFDREDSDGYELSLVVGYSAIPGSIFSISLGDGSFLSFQANSVTDAVEWAMKITGFEPAF